MDEPLNHAPCGFLTFADDGTIREVNATLLTLLGYERGEILGRHFEVLLPAGGRIFYQTHFFPVLKLHGRADEIYLSLRTRSGGDIPALVNVAARPAGNNDRVYDCVLVPMRQRSRFEAEILQARKAAEEATREKERAYAALAQKHEALEAATAELEAQQEALMELNAQLHARAQREALLNRIGEAIRSHREPQAILKAAVAALGEALDADRCYFTEYDTVRDRAQVRADWRRSDALPSLEGVYRISDFDMDVDALYRPGRGLLLVRNAQDAAAVFSPKAAAALGTLGLRSAIGIALFERGRPVASVTAAMGKAPRDWNARDVDLVQAVAALTRSAMDEARLREREHRIAEQLQEALRPAPPGKLAGLELAVIYQPALDEAIVGGDFYDVFTLQNACYAVVVADLAGKGLIAASQVATVRHMLRTLLYQKGASLQEAVTALNDMVIEHELLSDFATLFVGVYDAGARILTFVNAGQEPGLVRRGALAVGRDDDAIEELGPTGPVIGAVPGAAFTERAVPLAPGDVFALFTDGLTEARLSRTDLLGIAGVAEIFRESLDGAADPDEIAARCMAGVEATVAPEGIRDDVCLLIGRVE